MYRTNTISTSASNGRSDNGNGNGNGNGHGSGSGNGNGWNDGNGSASRRISCTAMNTNSITRRSIVKQISLALVALVSLATVASAQRLTAIIDAIYGELNAAGRYAVRIDDNDLTIIDPADGAELTRLSEVSDAQIVVSGVITYVDADNDATVEAVRERIGLYNDSAPVGTLDYDDATGMVMIRHNVNPKLASAASIAQVATLVADAVRSESRVIAAITNGTATACTSQELCSR